MKTVSPDVPPARVLLFGIRCQFTETVAARLSGSKYQPVGLILPGPPGIEQPFRLSPRQNVLPMASTAPASVFHDLPTYQVGRLTSSGTLELIDQLDPDLIVVACFPRLIPEAIHGRARLGGINIHPSLLPQHRGPDPLFWIMRDGGRGCGVTVHVLADRYDSGDILAQRPVPYPAGVRESELERRLAGEGAELALSVIEGLVVGRQSRTAQDEHQASYESWPAERDYHLDTRRSALDSWNFVRGVAERGVPIRIDAGDLLIRDAIAFGEDTEPPEAGDGELIIRCHPGWLRVSSMTRPIVDEDQTE